MKRVKELESLLSRLRNHSQTELSREREFKVESVNPYFEQQEECKETEFVSFARETPTNDIDDTEPTAVTPSGEGETCVADSLDEGADCNGTAKEIELSRDGDMVSKITRGRKST